MCMLRLLFSKPQHDYRPIPIYQRYRDIRTWKGIILIPLGLGMTTERWRLKYSAMLTNQKLKVLST